MQSMLKWMKVGKQSATGKQAGARVDGDAVVRPGSGREFAGFVGREAPDGVPGRRLGDRAAPGGVRAIIGILLAAALAVLAFGFGLVVPIDAAAEPSQGPVFIETPLATGPGDQVDPAVSGGILAYNDLAVTGGAVMIRDLPGGTAAVAAGPGVLAGPDTDAGHFAWQMPDYSACMKPATGGGETCVALPGPAGALVFAGDKAITSHDNKIIRLVNFGTGRSKILDSSTSAGDRYDPAIDGGRVVWVKDRGYAGQYYEPLIVDYDIGSDTTTYLTETGGGASSSGGSRHERGKPTVSGGDVLYQQRLREPGEQWDIYRAVAGTYGVPVVTEAGDQVNPVLSGNLLVYQDNRAGHLDTGGEWVGEWDLYLRDLDTGIEVPLCTAPGDQVNPRIEGDLVVWQDNRDGDWDIYGATLGDIPAGSPELTVRVEDAFWADLAEYTARKLTVRYKFSNGGNGAAHDFILQQIDTVPADVGVVQPPATVAAIPAGQDSVLDVGYHVPQGIILFKTSLFASCVDSGGTEMWFPRHPAG